MNSAAAPVSRDQEGAPLSGNDRGGTLRSGQLMRGGAYRILEPLGKGGMGALYLAADQVTFGRRCVVKELLDYYDPSDAEESRKAQKRFETEARLLAELSHPGIPRIYSYFSEAGRHYIVMEYIEGETLERAVTHIDALGRQVSPRPLAAEEVVRHAIRVCRVLEYLSAQPTPVIHHDVKPANLIVDQTSGEVRLVDFGTAMTRTPWATQAGLGQGASSPRRHRYSALFGTQGYAAPEQFQGRSDPRSDVYALAATVYHLLADDDPGDHPFQFPNMGSLPQPVADALQRALRPEIGRRSTALEFRQALEAWLIPEEIASPFVFRSGAVAHTTEELVALCDQHWADACLHLAEGDFDRWFRARNRHDLVAKARSAQLEPDTGAALEALLSRLNPRLERPMLRVDPPVLSFGRLTRTRAVIRRLTVRNETRGYGTVTFKSSVPWLQFEPSEAGCLAGNEAVVSVGLDADNLPMRREQQAVITCIPVRGARISIPVEAELNLVAEVLRRLGAAALILARLAGRGARWGMSLWARVFRSLIGTRYGAWALLAEMLALAAVMVALWWTWRGLPFALVDMVVGYLRALPLALLAVYIFPALALMTVGVLREASGALLRSGRGSGKGAGVGKDHP